MVPLLGTRKTKFITVLTAPVLRRSHRRIEYALRVKRKHKRRGIGWRRIVRKYQIGVGLTRLVLRWKVVTSSVSFIAYMTSRRSRRGVYKQQRPPPRMTVDHTRLGRRSRLPACRYLPAGLPAGAAELPT